MPRSTPSTAGDAPAIAPVARPGCVPPSREGQGITRESRQDAAAFLAAQRLGMTAQQADALVAGMQAQRRALATERAAAVAELALPAGERMARRAEKHAADVAAARAESLQAVAPVGGTMREARGSAVHVETVTRQVQMRSKLTAS